MLHCNVRADIGFILDSSYSLRHKYSDEKYFLKKLVSNFDITVNDVRSSVVTFSSRSELSIKFSDHSTTSSFNSAVDAIPLMGLLTRIDRALRTTQREMFLTANGARTGIPKILVLITDGAQTRKRNYEEPALIAAELRNSGIYLVVVGVGTKVKRDELVSIAGDEKRVFTSASFEELITDDFIEKIALVTCPGKFYTQ